MIPSPCRAWWPRAPADCPPGTSSVPSFLPGYLNQARKAAQQAGSTHPAQRWVSETLPCNCCLSSARSCLGINICLGTMSPNKCWGTLPGRPDPRGSWQERGISPQGTPCLTLGCWSAGPRPGRPPARTPLRFSACVSMASQETSCQLERNQEQSELEDNPTATPSHRGAASALHFLHSLPSPNLQTTVHFISRRWEFGKSILPLCAFR